MVGDYRERRREKVIERHIKGEKVMLSRYWASCFAIGLCLCIGVAVAQEQSAKPTDQMPDISGEWTGTWGIYSPAQGTAPPSGKNLVVAGGNFDAAAVVLLNGAPQVTIFTSSISLVGKKSVKQIPHGQSAMVTVQNGDGVISQAASFTRP
jgi:hypothetical protein